MNQNSKNFHIDQKEKLDVNDGDDDDDDEMRILKLHNKMCDLTRAKSKLTLKKVADDCSKYLRRVGFYLSSKTK